MITPVKRVTAGGGIGLLVVVVLATAAGGIADLAGAGTLLFSDGFEAWVRRHALAVFWVALGLILLLAVVIAVIARSRDSARTERDDAIKDKTELAERAENDAAELNARLAEVSAELEQLKQEPTTHDRNLFARFVDMFPAGDVTIEYLTNWFTGESWDWEQLQQLRTFHGDWGAGNQFLDEHMQQALAELRLKSRQFLGEIWENTHKTVPDEPLSYLDESRLRRMKPFTPRAPS